MLLLALTLDGFALLAWAAGAWNGDVTIPLTWPAVLMFGAAAALMVAPLLLNPFLMLLGRKNPAMTDRLAFRTLVLVIDGAGILFLAIAFLFQATVLTAGIPIPFDCGTVRNVATFVALITSVVVISRQTSHR